jgi:hypothetical protein
LTIDHIREEKTMKEKVKNTGPTPVTLSSLTVVSPYSMRVHGPSPDYSAYFEPTTDITRRITANAESVAGGIPDFSNYFEPVSRSARRPIRLGKSSSRRTVPSS